MRREVVTIGDVEWFSRDAWDRGSRLDVWPHIKYRRWPGQLQLGRARQMAACMCSAMGQASDLLESLREQVSNVEDVSTSALTTPGRVLRSQVGFNPLNPLDVGRELGRLFGGGGGGAAPSDDGGGSTTPGGKTSGPTGLQLILIAMLLAVPVMLGGMYLIRTRSS
jgi:hypothetical protein